MKVLITGAGGFLGVQVIKRLLVHGYTDIRCFLRDPAKSEQLRQLALSYPQANIEISIGNLRSISDCLRAVQDASLVIHLAAGLKGAAAEVFDDSVTASRNLLEAIGSRTGPPASQTRVVLVSSFGVYGAASLQRGALIDETTALETHPEWRDTYAHSKLRQEQLFREVQARLGFQLVVLRPGVIYGPGGGRISNRVGLQLGPLFLHLGGENSLPLSYVENCAEAVAIAAAHPASSGQTYNVHDDDLVTASQYLRIYKKSVKRLPVLRLPYRVTWLLAWALEIYHRGSQAPSPAILTRYKVAAQYGGNRFTNARLHSIGWRQIVPTGEALKLTFESFRQKK